MCKWVKLIQNISGGLKQVQTIFLSRWNDLWELACVLFKNATTSLKTNSDSLAAIQAFPTYSTLRKTQTVTQHVINSKRPSLGKLFALDNTNPWVGIWSSYKQARVKSFALEDFCLSDCPVPINPALCWKSVYVHHPACVFSLERGRSTTTNTRIIRTCIPGYSASEYSTGAGAVRIPNGLTSFQTCSLLFVPSQEQFYGLNWIFVRLYNKLD